MSRCLARLARLAFAVAALAACKNPSPLDHPPRAAGAADASPAAADPWASKPSDARASDGDDKRDKDKDKDTGGGGLGGFDIQAILSKIKDGIQKPGPYETPEQSPSFDPQLPHWGVMRIHGAIVERQAFSLMGGHGTELRELVERFHDLAADDKLAGLILRLDGVEISLPDAVELRAALHAYRAKGKHLACHVETAATGTYLVAAACEQLALAPLGEVLLPGPAAMPIHLKGLLDKLGVTADFVHVGAYKGAAEPLTRDAPSDEMMTVLNAILDQRYQTTVKIVADERHLEPAKVQQLIDIAMFPAPHAKDAKLVDEVTTFEVFRDRAVASANGAWVKIDLESDKQNPLEAALKLARFVGAMPPEKPIGPHVALIYAVGNIVDGDGDGVLGARDEIASRTLVAAIRAVARDENVKAVVLRIDSGGGSAQASELIWLALQELQAKKPVVVSMSDVAASGGYYIASGAVKIYALDDTLTGSIGVVGGKIAPAGALAKLGVTTFPIGKGKRATMMASLSPWTDDERAAVLASMQDVYEVFKSRVGAGRHKTAAELEPIAQGHVWTGAKAKELGLVDDIGGLDAALADARARAKVDAAVPLEVYPPSPTLRDVLHRFGQVQAPLGLGSSIDADLAELGAVEPELAAQARRLLELVVSFRTTTIQTVAIVPEIR